LTGEVRVRARNLSHHPVPPEAGLKRLYRVASGDKEGINSKRDNDF